MKLFETQPLRCCAWQRNDSARISLSLHERGYTLFFSRFHYSARILHTQLQLQCLYAPTNMHSSEWREYAYIISQNERILIRKYLPHSFHCPSHFVTKRKRPVLSLKREARSLLMHERQWTGLCTISSLTVSLSRYVSPVTLFVMLHKISHGCLETCFPDS